MSDQIAAVNKATYRGIPAMTVGWTGTAAHSLTVMSSVDKTPTANVKESIDSDGETMGMDRTNKRMKVKFSAKPVGATRAAALAIAQDLPMPMDILTIGSDDAQIDSAGNTIVCDSANAKWSPDNELTVDIEATVWLGKTFAAIAG